MQNDSGDLFAVAYHDNGVFHLLTFTIQGGVQQDVNVNAMFGINNHTIPIRGLLHPICICCFTSASEVFFTFFHRTTKTHYHFIYNTQTKTSTQGIQSHHFADGTVKNFPQKCFYDPEAGTVHVFYRQGYLIEVDASEIRRFSLEKLSDFDLGDIVIWKY